MRQLADRCDLTRSNLDDARLDYDSNLHEFNIWNDQLKAYLKQEDNTYCEELEVVKFNEDIAALRQSILNSRMLTASDTLTNIWGLQLVPSNVSYSNSSINASYPELIRENNKWVSKNKPYVINITVQEIHENSIQAVGKLPNISIDCNFSSRIFTVGTPETYTIYDILQVQQGDKKDGTVYQNFTRIYGSRFPINLTINNLTVSNVIFIPVDKTMPEIALELDTMLFDLLTYSLETSLLINLNYSIIQEELSNTISELMKGSAMANASLQNKSSNLIKKQEMAEKALAEYNAGILPWPLWLTIFTVPPAMAFFTYACICAYKNTCRRSQFHQVAVEPEAPSAFEIREMADVVQDAGEDELIFPSDIPEVEEQTTRLSVTC
jgi:hypothetical protein